MIVEENWTDVCFYDIYFQKKGEKFERKIHRSVAVPANWSKGRISAYFLEAFKDIIITSIDYMNDGWYPLIPD